MSDAIKYSINSLISKTPKERARILSHLNSNELEFVLHDWRFWAREKQLPPPGDWTFWAVICGRGWGKGWTGSHFVIERASLYPDKLIGIWGQTADDVKTAMICDNPSSILKQSPPWFIPEHQAANRRVVWPNGAIAEVYYGDVPDQARGPEIMTAWIDELAKFKYPNKCWDNIEFCLRAEPDPRGVITTTPRPIDVIKNLFKDPGVVITGGSMYENAANLSEKFMSRVERKYEGTDFGDQELHGKIVVAALKGRVYKRFNEGTHVERFDPNEIEGDWFVAMDFNVNPCIWLLGVFDGDTVYFYDEICLRDTDTIQMSDELINRYNDLGINDIVVYGDASGTSRTTKSRKTDYRIISEHGFTRQDVDRKNPAVVDRLNCVNSSLYRGKILIHPNCVELITDFNEVIWKKGAKGIVDSSNSDRTHASDAAGYRIFKAFGKPALKKATGSINM